MKKPILIVGLVVVAVVAVGGYLVFQIFDDDAPPELSLDSGDDTDNPASDAPTELDGQWTVKSEEPTTAGFRITETFLSGTASNTAVGRTSSVTGDLTVAGTTVSEAQFTVDMTSLEYTDSPAGLDVGNRKRALENVGIQTGSFPEASFKLTEPIDFGEVPEDNQQIEAEATGELTLHGVTEEVTFSVDAKLDGGDLTVVSHSPVPVSLADYDIDPPVVGPVASVSDDGAFEFLLVLNKA
jgi:polyisoprenoid-binding protein YceI